MQTDFELEQLTHAALVQYYRWYQVYEVPFTGKRIENQKEILSDDIEINTHAGTTIGKDGLEERLRVYEGWLNAHHVQHVDVKRFSAEELLLDADIIYQNIRPDESQYCYSIHYSTILKIQNDGLPVFTKLNLQPTGEIKTFTFTSAYAENRSKSFIYYWFYLMETFQHAQNTFVELLTPDFSIHTAEDMVINTEQALFTYINVRAEKIKTNVYEIANIRIKKSEEDIFTISMDVLWKFISSDGQYRTEKNQYHCMLTNTKDERFARVKEMRIKTVY